VDFWELLRVGIFTSLMPFLLPSNCAEALKIVKALKADAFVCTNGFSMLIALLT